MANALKTQDPMLYDLDFFAWTQDQGAKLRARAAFDSRGDVDWENDAEEIESVGRSDRKEIRNRLRVPLAHLLKWQYQTTKRKSGWRSTIIEQRQRLRLVLEDSPSLRTFPSEALESAHEMAAQKAQEETDLPPSTFPAVCPYSADEALRHGFYPGDE